MRSLLRRSIAASVVILAVASVARAAGPADEMPYLSLYRDVVLDAMNRQPARTPKPADMIGIAYAAWLVGERGQEPRLREFARAEYDRLLTLEAAREDRDFHLTRPFGLLTLALADANELTGDRRAEARRWAESLLAWFVKRYATEEKWFDCNIALADTIAADCLARAFAADPALPHADVRRLVDRLGTRIVATGDLNENASNYSSLGICFFLELARLEGWLDLVARSEHFRAMFVRMRDIVSPAGSIPEYGDGYFRAREPRLDFVLLLETATRLYDDGSFRSVARRLVPASAAAIDADSFPRAFALLALEPFTPSRASEPPVSVVHYRRTPGPPAVSVADKLILRTGTAPGSAMVMLDLYADGSHAHRFKRPSIGYYESAGVPLFHNIGRRGTNSGQCGNSFWAFPDPALFPGHPRENAWNTMSIPATYLAARGKSPPDVFPRMEASGFCGSCAPEIASLRSRRLFAHSLLAAGPEAGQRTVSDSLVFRTFRTPGLEMAWFDNLRLEGPAGTILLDGFESPASWHGNIAKKPGVRLRTSDDHTEGMGSQEVNLGIFGDQFCTRILEQPTSRGMTFAVADYETVRLDYKFKGRPPHANLRGLFADWIDLGDHPLHCAVASARVEQSAAGAVGDLEFADYIAAGSRLRRRIGLVDGGGLVVVDRFTPAPRTAGWAAGQLWQLYEIAARGPDWFASASDGAYPQADGSTSERRMLVKFMVGAGTTIHEERVVPGAMHAPRADGTKHASYHTVASRHLVGSAPITAAMTVVPLTADDDPAVIADRIRFERFDGDGVLVHLPTEGGVATAECTADGLRLRRGE